MSSRASCPAPSDLQRTSSLPLLKMTMFARSHGHKGPKSATRLCERTSGVIDAIDLERCESAPKRASSASDSVNSCSNGRCDTEYTKGVWDVSLNSAALNAIPLVSGYE